MRSDYTLYTVALIFFVLTGIILAYQIEYRELYVVSTVILGLLCIGVGYYYRPKAKAVAEAATSTVPIQGSSQPLQPTEAQPIVQETTPKVETAVAQVVEKPTASTLKLTDVKGIGEKRATQLKAIGVETVEALAKASAEDIASKLKVSPKIVSRWIEEAKKLIEKT